MDISVASQNQTEAVPAPILEKVAIAKRLVEIRGGQFTIKSTPNETTTIQLGRPVAEVKEDDGDSFDMSFDVSRSAIAQSSRVQPNIA